MTTAPRTPRSKKVEPTTETEQNQKKVEPTVEQDQANDSDQSKADNLDVQKLEPSKNILTVKNNTNIDLYEPISKVTLLSGQVTDIECTQMNKKSVLSNIKQFIELGHLLEILDDNFN